MTKCLALFGSNGARNARALTSILCACCWDPIAGLAHLETPAIKPPNTVAHSTHLAKAVELGGAEESVSALNWLSPRAGSANALECSDFIGNVNVHVVVVARTPGVLVFVGLKMHAIILRIHGDLLGGCPDNV